MDKRTACIAHRLSNAGYQSKCSDCRAENRIERDNRKRAHVDPLRSTRAKDAWDQRS